MRDMSFFQEIEHIEVPWRDRYVHCPLFYYDTMRLSVLYQAPMDKLKALLPSGRMHPYRLTPGSGVLAISVMEFKDTDIGPYNEVAIAIPLTLDKPTPLFTGILRKSPAEPHMFIHQLPLTTEIARDLGVDLANYPKFLTDISFEKGDEWISCRLAEGNDHILTLTGRVLAQQKTSHTRTHYLTVRGGRILRSESTGGAGMAGWSRNAADVRLELGNHPIAQELKSMGLGRMLAYQYSTNVKSILTPAIESWAI